MIKCLFCVHSWKHVHSLMFGKSTYGCTKCGTTRKLHSYDVSVWKFKRGMKGDTFE